MNRKQKTLLKVLLALFALNSLSLYFYFSDHHHNNDKETVNRPHLTEIGFSLTENLTRSTENRFSKSWPILPSYLPWSPPSSSSAFRFRSCEAYFGNGFNRRVNLLPSPTSSSSAADRGGGGGWFRCFYSETLRSSICEGGRIKMNVDRIRMSKGGERLEEVIGRGEEEELPEFDDGAFEIEGSNNEVEKKNKKKNNGFKLASDEFLDEFVPHGDILKHTMRGLIGSIRVVGAKDFDCDQVGLGN